MSLKSNTRKFLEAAGYSTAAVSGFMDSYHLSYVRAESGKQLLIVGMTRKVKNVEAAKRNFMRSVHANLLHMFITNSAQQRSTQSVYTFATNGDRMEVEFNRNGVLNVYLIHDTKLKV